MRSAARILAALALAALAGCIGGSSGPVPIGTDIFKEFQLTPSGSFNVTFKISGVVLRDVTPRVKVDGVWIATAAYATSSRTADADGATWTFADPRYPTLVYTVRRPEGTDHYEVRMTVEGGVGVVEGFEVLAAEDVTVPDLRDVLYFLNNGYNTFSFSGLVGLSAADRAERTPEGGVLLTGANFEDANVQAGQGWW
ncbi:MAG: hypothetical protein K8I02_05510, partial [Candidatus Methylomirabilis sp.]|nr:hypothetical protein [Deltaproteobacteria bacterium]